jgi:hypothetical protein
MHKRRPPMSLVSGVQNYPPFDLQDPPLVEVVPTSKHLDCPALVKITNG